MSTVPRHVCTLASELRDLHGACYRTFILSLRKLAVDSSCIAKPEVLLLCNYSTRCYIDHLQWSCEGWNYRAMKWVCSDCARKCDQCVINYNVWLEKAQKRICVWSQWQSRIPRLPLWRLEEGFACLCVTTRQMHGVYNGLKLCFMRYTVDSSNEQLDREDCRSCRTIMI